MNQKSRSILKVKESYFGLFLGFIASLQIKSNRMFLLEGEYNNGSLFSIVLICLFGFFLGYYFYLKNEKTF